MIQSAGIQTTLNPYVSNPSKIESFSYSQSGTSTTQESFSYDTDKVSLSYSSESVVTYDSSLKLQGVKNDGFDLLRGLVLNMFKEQGLSTTFDGGGTEVNLEELSQEDAAALVADDGYFGVDKTSSRIVDFAIGIAGGDRGKIEAIKAGVEKGFQEAYDAFGGWLPEISSKTYDAIMEKLDAWVNDGDQAS